MTFLGWLLYLRGKSNLCLDWKTPKERVAFGKAQCIRLRYSSHDSYLDGLRSGQNRPKSSNRTSSRVIFFDSFESIQRDSDFFCRLLVKLFAFIDPVQ